MIVELSIDRGLAVAIATSVPLAAGGAYVCSASRPIDRQGAATASIVMAATCGALALSGAMPALAPVSVEGALAGRASAVAGSGVNVVAIAVQVALVAALLASLRLAVGALQLGRLRRGARALAPELLSQVGADRLPCFAVAAATRPFCAGIRRPWIALPASLVDEAAGGDPTARSILRAVIAHERAHLRFRHPLHRTAIACAAPLLAWHPLFWFLSVKQRASCEALADELAAIEVGRSNYVRALVALAHERASRAPWTAVALWSRGGGELERRLRSVAARTSPLAVRSDSRQRRLRTAGIATTTVVALLLSAAASVPALPPRTVTLDLELVGEDRVREKISVLEAAGHRVFAAETIREGVDGRRDVRILLDAERRP